MAFASTSWVIDLVKKCFTKKKNDFVPTGTIINFMGNVAPNGYFICDGSTYNIADYSDFCDYLTTQFGSVNYFGGDGTTTFAVPDLRGEFLRGTGTNSHSGCGSGAVVGCHQKPTGIPQIGGDSTWPLWFYTDSTGKMLESNPDCYDVSDLTTDRAKRVQADSNVNTTWSHALHYTARPTNTSVLYCIKY